MLRAIVTGFLVILCASHAFCLPFESNITKGNRFYCKTKFKQAGELYSKTAADIAAYNLGNALYKQKKFAESERMFNTLTRTKNEKLKEKVYYNLGNSQFRQEDYKSAVRSYEMATKLNPADKEAKHNLTLAKKMLKMPKSKNQNPKNPQNKQNKQNKQRQDSNKGKEMSREDAERILQEIGADERHKGKRVEGKGMGNGLDW
ncbi:MAG: tetratricopeptide repeat protein [Candidatus Desantisbacteria bacterium]